MTSESDDRDRNEGKRLDSALVIGGTGFVGRHTVADLLDHGYDVTAVSRDSQGYRFPDRLPVERSIARTVEESLASGRDGSAFDPERDAEERLLDALAG